MSQLPRATWPRVAEVVEVFAGELSDANVKLGSVTLATFEGVRNTPKKPYTYSWGWK